jgi:tryptophan halogenase
MSGNQATKSRQIVIVGGGTAGWMAALMAQQNYPTSSITLIESDAIGILGAGEGTTPHFVSFLNEVGISLAAIADKCKATFKFGIDFQNWSNPNEGYFHAFSANHGLDNHNFMGGCVTDYVVKNNLPIDDVQLYPPLNKDCRVPVRFEDVVFVGDNKMSCVNIMAEWGVHFDARLLAKTLREIAEARGVRRVEGVVAGQTTAGDRVTSVCLDDGSTVPVDFLFDCTGFARKFIGALYNTPWVSYSDFLPMDSAVPFFLPHDNNVPAMTSAIAMDAGWMWRIPVQGRYGCGYVFDSRYTSKDEALREASDYLGVEVNSEKVFSFKAGCYERALVGNCVAVGLAQGFVEPLEATSLWCTYLTLRELFGVGLFAEKSSTVVEDFNHRVLQRNRNIAHFLHLHYLGTRKSSKFWTEFKDVNKTPVEILDVIQRYENGVYHTIPDTVFSLRSHVAVLRGLGYVSSAGEKECVSPDIVAAFVANQQRVSTTFMSHKALLNWISSDA